MRTRSVAALETRRAVLRRSVGAVAAATFAAGGAASSRCAGHAAPHSQAPDTVRIVSALPLSGPSYGQSISIVHAIRLAVEEAGRRAGPFVVDYEIWDDASAGTGESDPQLVAELAEQAVSDPNVLVYIGHLTSEATRIALPILNAQGLVTISPSSTAPGLTKSLGGAPSEPQIHYPSGIRSFARVIPSDETQGAAGAGWAKVLGASTAYALDDGTPYGRMMSAAFTTACPRVGIRSAGSSSLNPNGADLGTALATVRTASPDVIYLGASTEGGAAAVLRELRRGGYVKHVIGPNGIRDALFVAQADTAAEGVWATSIGVPPAFFDATLSEWRARFTALSQAEPDLLALYGYDAARVALAAVGNAGVRDRNAVREHVLATREFPGLLGTWSFDANGDTTDTTATVSRVSRSGGQLEWVPLDLVTAP